MSISIQSLRYTGTTPLSVPSHHPLPPSPPLFSLQAEYSNKRHRPIGIGVQGLADAFILLRFPFDSPEARELNKKIFETIYFAALTASCELAQEEGPYATYQGSPVSKGVSIFFLKLVLGDYLSSHWTDSTV